MAVELSVPIIQVVGYQNSGKTTLAEKIIRRLSENGKQVATIKHHGHGGMPVEGDGGKDSQRHRQAGAIISSVEGDGALTVHATKQSGWELEEIIRLYSSFEIDMIIIEGYKMASYPKIVLIRKNEDLLLLKKIKNVVAIITWIPIKEEKENIPIYKIDNDDRYLEWIELFLEDLHE